jgi:hypothetical protein
MNTRVHTYIYCVVAFLIVLTVALRVYAVEISNVTITAIDDSSATVEWATDGPTDGTINYGLDAAVGLVRDPSFSNKKHSLRIDNLDPTTTYHFRVVSADEAGNRNATAGFVFTTKGSIAAKAVKEIKKIKDPEALKEIVEAVKEVAEDVLREPSIIGLPKVALEDNKVIVSWSTDREAGSEVQLVPDAEYDPNSNDPYTITQGNGNASEKAHVVEVIGLEPSTLYHFRVRSEDAAGLTGISEDDTFRTRSLLPEITNIQTSRIQENSATVSWSTRNVKAKGIVSYTNLRTKKTQSTGNPVFATEQRVLLAGLEFGTRYQVIITATNEAGDNVDSKPFTFVTVRDVIPPEISKVSNESTLFPSEDTKIQTIVSWLTDEPAYCQVFYAQGLIKKEGEEGDSLLKEANPLTNHTQVIVGFAPATVYKFWMKCHDESQNESQSEDYVLITPIKEKNIIDVILENFQGTFGWVNKVGK